MYDFTTSINRAGSGSIKIDMAPEPVKGSGFIPLTIADQEFAVAPEIRKAICDSTDAGIFGYTYADSLYKDAVSSWMLRRHNWDISDYQLFTVNGVVTALGAIIRSLTNKGDGVVIQPPVYPPFAGAVRGNERRLVENPLIYIDGTYRMDYDDLYEKTKPDDVKLLILCSPHNPVGRVWTRAELTQLADICKQNNVIVISDEIHNDLLRPGVEHTVFATIDGMAENSVICTAVSKTFNLAGLSCSNIFTANKTIADKLQSTLSRENTSCVPYFARIATIFAYNEAEAWLDELNRVIADNFDCMYDFIDSNLPMLHAVRAEGTYLAWVDMRSLNLTDSELESTMLANHLALDEGYIFGTNGSGFERWNLALPKVELISALNRLKTAVSSIIK